jgi:hypothetical protein
MAEQACGKPSKSTILGSVKKIAASRLAAEDTWGKKITLPLNLYRVRDRFSIE